MCIYISVYFFALNKKWPAMPYRDVKLICKVILLNKMLFIVDLGVGNLFYISTMLEFDHDHGIRFLVFFHLSSLSYF